MKQTLLPLTDLSLNERTQGPNMDGFTIQAIRRYPNSNYLIGGNDSNTKLIDYKIKDSVYIENSYAHIIILG